MTGRQSAGGTRRLVVSYDAPTTTESFEGPFLSVARRHSLCDDDAWEALGRSFEIALRRRNRIRPETAGAWFATVVRHEAMRVRRGRYRELPIDAAAYEPPAEQPDPEREPDPRLPALRAAMRQLKPDERRALILFYGMDADGRRYRRIMRITGWSYTKVNRCLSEGRATLRALLVGDAGRTGVPQAAPPAAPDSRSAGAAA
jgi:DNA-directed RNA polymerase specialized sigma24 family protein